MIFKEMLMWNRRQFLLGLSLVLVAGGVLGLSAARAQISVGDLLTGKWGQYREDIRLNREDAVAKYSYCPTGGCLVRLESVEVVPVRARKGETLTLITSYTILTPEQVAIPVTVSREIFYQGKSLGKVKDIASRRLNGTWRHDIDFTLPANAAPGVYTLVTKVSTGYGQDEKSALFTVE
jgi:hypothetical protein